MHPCVAPPIHNAPRDNGCRRQAATPWHMRMPYHQPCSSVRRSHFCSSSSQMPSSTYVCGWKLFVIIAAGSTSSTSSSNSIALIFWGRRSCLWRCVWTAIASSTICSYMNMGFAVGQPLVPYMFEQARTAHQFITRVSLALILRAGNGTGKEQRSTLLLPRDAGSSISHTYCSCARLLRR